MVKEIVRCLRVKEEVQNPLLEQLQNDLPKILETIILYNLTNR